MTRGRHHNTAHIVADTVGDARQQWIEVFHRGQADLGPRHAAHAAAEAVDRYSPDAPRRHPVLHAAALSERHGPEHHQPSYGSDRDRSPGISI